MSTKVELLKKIKALADSGNDGERKSAQKKLNELMAKYKVTECELDDERQERHYFKFASDIERRLLQQTIFKVTNSTKIYRGVINGKYDGKKLNAYCTKAQAIEIEYLFDFYKRTWKKELDLFYMAFIQKHRIFGDDDSGNGGQEYDDETLKRLFEMVDALSDETPQKQIEEKNGG